MKKILYYLVLFISVFSIPQFSFAAFNDATLTTDAVISVGGYTLNISGSSAVVESIAVSSGSFSVTLGSGSSFAVSSPSLNEMNTDISTGVTKVCTSSASSITLASAATVTITPSATICSGSGSTPSSGGSSGSRSTRSTNTVNNTPAPAVPTTPTPTPTASKFLRDLSVGTTGADVKSLQIFLNARGYTIASTGPGSPGNETDSFGQLTRLALIRYQQAQAISPTGFFGPLTRASVNIAPVTLATNTPVSPVGAPNTPVSPTVFTRDLKLGDTHAEVVLLQKYLNTHGFIITTTGGGSPGNETEYFGQLTQQALMKFQTSKGLPSTGYFGPLTRAAISN